MPIKAANGSRFERQSLYATIEIRNQKPNLSENVRNKCFQTKTVPLNPPSPAPILRESREDFIVGPGRKYVLQFPGFGLACQKIQFYDPPSSE
jgi:hypothetical protein